MKPIKRTCLPVGKVKLIKHCIIGVDEAGRGAWAGPVVAACVEWSGRNPIRGKLWDSKMLKPHEREKTYEEIFKLREQWKLTLGVGIVDASVIDEVGIREANRLAMLEALRSMNNEKWIMNNGGILLKIDGRDNYSFDIPGLPNPKYIVRGDSKIKQIMAASIIAKVTRDRLMTDFENQFIGYGFAKHKGYGTALHQKTLQELGVCEIHRRSYKPCSE
jgi:ribonuclease HII